MADTLDVHIAQREFEAAMEIIVEAEAALADLEDCEAVREVKEANTTRKDALIQVQYNTIQYNTILFRYLSFLLYLYLYCKK